MNPRTWRSTALHLTLSCLLASTLFALPFFFGPLRPWPDQGLTLQAARRHALGQGLTVPVWGTELSTPEALERLTYFPPLYPLAVSVGLRAGVELDLLVKLANALALSLGTWGWCTLAARHLPATALRLAFAGLLVVAAGANVPRGGTTDLLLWAAVPGWVAGLLASERRLRAGQALGRALWPALAAGVLAGLLVGVRWATVFVVPSTLLFVLLRAWRARADRSARAWLALLLVSALPVVGAYLTLHAVNARANAGRASVLSYVTPRLEWANLRTLTPLEQLVTVPLALEPLATRVWRALEPTRSSGLGALIFRLALPLLVLALLVTRRPTISKPASDADRVALLQLGAATLVSLVVFLAYLSVRYTWAFAVWSYLDEARYYRPVWPLAALLWLARIEHLALPARRAALLSLALAVVYVGQAQARATWHAWHTPEESWELVQRVRALEAQPGQHVVFDNDVSDYVAHAGPRLLARLYPEPALVPQLHSAQSLNAWLVWRPHQPTAYMRARDYDRTRFEHLRARLGAQRVWVSSGGAYELWHAAVAADGLRR